MNAMQSDNKLFHQLVQNQRKQKPNVDFMIFNEQEVDDTDKNPRRLKRLFFRIVQYEQ
jgi:hypothetical protein